MSFSDLFDSGFKQRNESHFAAIVRVAMDDGVISPEERAFLERLARKLDIDEEDYNSILKNYNTHPLNPPVSQERRVERLYDLARMVHLDKIQDDPQHELLKKICVGLGFRSENVQNTVDKALDLLANGADMDTFMEEMKHMH